MTSAVTKKCPKCKAEYPATPKFFYRHAASKDGLQSYCKKCGNKGSLEWDTDHKAAAKNRKLKRMYGVDLSWYDAMFRAQGGVCAICGKPETATDKCGVRKLAVDHDHKTGKVRGLLCYKCNMGVGYLRDDPAIISRAATYLLERTE